MQNYINDARELCQNQEPCIAKWNKLRKFYDNKQDTTSLTHLNGLEGSIPIDEKSLYGAEFMPVDIHTPYYERMTTETVEVPWLAQWQEQTFMNRTKVLNERPVKEYQEIIDTLIKER